MNQLNDLPKGWGEVISEFLSIKKKTEEEKYIKELIKSIEKDCEKNNFYNHKAIQDYFSEGKLKKGMLEDSIDFQRRRIIELFKIKTNFISPVKVSSILDLDPDAYKKKVDEIDEKYSPSRWISKASKDAASVSFATHVSKLTHSKIDSPSIYDQVGLSRTDYITTSSLAIKAIDGAVAGNQFAPIFQFLELECNGIKLAAELSNQSSTALSDFSEKDEYLAWNKGFAKALASGSPASHFLSKQVYFPLINSRTAKVNEYHILCNIKSSSMAQAIFEKIFSDENKDCRKLFQGGKFSGIENRFFSKMGKVSVTASNHSNASQLNGKRGGKLHLFSSEPPLWVSQLKLPIYRKSVFDSQLLYYISINDVNYLRDFLIHFDRLDLSIRHPERRKWINGWVNRIIEDVLSYAASIQNMESGWSATENIRLKREHQFFLDAYRENEAFQVERKFSDWQAVVCEDFARWLNWILVGKDKKFSPQSEHTRMWIKLMGNPLREHDEVIKMEMETGKVKA